MYKDHVRTRCVRACQYSRITRLNETNVTKPENSEFIFCRFLVENGMFEINKEVTLCSIIFSLLLVKIIWRRIIWWASPRKEQEREDKFLKRIFSSSNYSIESASQEVARAYRVISILPSLFSQLLLPLFLEGTERNCTYTRKLDKSGKGSSMLASMMAV